MSLSQKNLAFIQKAGQAVHGAAEAIAENLRTQAEGMVASLSSQPFSVESEQVVARFKALSRLSQGLVDAESHLQELFAIAAELANPASDVIILPTVTKRKASNAEALDVLAKPAGGRKVAAKKASKRPAKPVSLTANDTKLLHYLQGVLKADEWTTLTGADMAKDGNLPLGSVGVSLKKVLASGAIKLGNRSMYRLGAAPAAQAATAAPASEAEAKSTPVKKAKAVAAKKPKATKAAAPAAKEAKAKPARKAKSAAAPVADAPAADAEAAPV